VEKVESRRTIWRFNHKCRSMERGRQLRIETLSPATVHWSFDSWRTTSDSSTRDTGLGVYVVDLATEGLISGERVDFTFYWPDVAKWEQTDFALIIEDD
jgi:glucoamylase